MHVPTSLCSTFFLYELRSILSTLKTVLGTLVHSLSSAGLTEINSFPVAPPLVSLPLDCGQTLSFGASGARGACALVTGNNTINKMFLRVLGAALANSLHPKRGPLEPLVYSECAGSTGMRSGEGAVLED